MDPQINRLLLSAEQGNLGVVSALLEKSIHVDSADDEGVNALHTASANGDEKVVRLLLSRGASLEARTIYGWTALMLAAYYGHYMVCWILIQNKSDLYARNELGSTALDCAVRSGHVQIAGLLIEAGQVNGQVEGPQLCLDTPLMNAAQHGHEACLKLLLEKGANANCRQETTGWTALMLAALNGHMTAAEILVEFGANPNAVNDLDQTALEIAALRQKTEVQGYLDEITTKRPQIKGQKFVKPSIIEAARNGNFASVRDLLEEGEVDVNATDDDGATPLMYAAMGGHFPSVQLLIQNGADIDKQDKASGWTALMQATYYGHKAVAKLLIDAGANVNIQEKNGCTAFDMATVIGDTEILRLLASVSMHVPATPKRYYSSSNLYGRKGKGEGKGPVCEMNKDMANVDSDFITDTGRKNWWSKMSSRFRHLNIKRTLKVSSSGSKLRISPASNSMESLFDSDSGQGSSFSHVSDSSAITLKSLDSVITESGLKGTTQLNLKRPPTLALVSHSNKLPDDVIGPVLPPILPSPSFELPRIQRQQHSNSLDDPSLPERPVPSLCINGECIPDAHEKYFEDDLDNISSVSAYPAYRSLMSPTLAKSKNFTGSPESSYSTASFYSSMSNNSGSRTLKACSPAIDLSFNPMSAMSSSLWHKAGRGTAASPTPTVMTVRSAPVEGTSLRKELSYSSLQGHADDTSRSFSSYSRDHYPYRHTFNHSEGDVENLLNKLSLEKYQPIFEEQEVDMESFLTLSDGDLSELGVTRKDARQQILTAIAEIKSSKDRERQHLHETLSSFQGSKSHGTSGYSSVSPSASGNLSNWPLKQPP
ncbi:ankyrin repeat and SAM domain-containing protein 6-like isoform X1 [Pocillopora damicornis]|uniref:ankyrin repeat and SAM domain-containing protein 6-like isoform X1 n=1 Tax=Pocillopora damicornis TaxID=46731 RepID=UPI000F54D69A|nr:ankyrin repeat and SAM domain-containing protein 6-like isoform X1 [Pocillopora damicornis]